MLCDASTMTDPFDYEFDINGKNSKNQNKKQTIKVAVKKPNTTLLEPFEVIWKDLTYKVSQKGVEKLILNNISGFFKSGHVTAILGPSGSGKSTLLGCISGIKKSGVSGSITISTEREVKFSFISQEDYLSDKLQIRESLIYASKLKNMGRVDHKCIVDIVLYKLKIEECANLKPKMCSGGQKKRISIALELVSRPNILILDEPTSGLDAVTTWHLVTTLCELTKQKESVAVVATIHQPSAKLFNLFNFVYIMSFDGQCLYHGSPQTMINKLMNYGLKCPQFHNPSDFVLEIASNVHGIAKVMLLSTDSKIQSLDLKPFKNTLNRNHKYKTLRHIWILTLRSFIETIRNPIMLQLRIFSYIFCSFLITIMFGSDSGQLSGCPQDFVAAIGGPYIENYKRVTYDIYENISCVFFLVLFQWFGTIIPLLLTFPQEINLFFKESNNGWYSCFSYFISKVICDIPFQTIIPILFSIPGYLMTGQYYRDEWRIYYFTFISILVAFNASSQGLMVSAAFSKYPNAAVFVGVLTALPMILFSGLLSRFASMPIYFQWISYANYMRFALETAIVDVYGFNRCAQNPISNHNTTDWTEIIPLPALLEIYNSDKININALLSALKFFSVDDSENAKSIAILNFDLNDNTLYEGLVMLALIMFVNFVLTYIFILRKTKSHAY